MKFDKQIIRNLNWKDIIINHINTYVFEGSENKYLKNNASVFEVINK